MEGIRLKDGGLNETIAEVDRLRDFRAEKRKSQLRRILAAWHAWSARRALLGRRTARFVARRGAVRSGRAFMAFRRPRPVARPPRPRVRTETSGGGGGAPL